MIILSKEVIKIVKGIAKYMGKHPKYNAVVHLLAGLGIGVLIARPYIGHPIRIGVVLLAVAVVGHLYPMFSKR